MFDIDFNKKAELLLYRRKFLLYPEHWKDPLNHVQLNLTWHYIEFNRANRNAAPAKKGVYCFIVKPNTPNFFETNYLFYVGETTRTLRQRFKEYLNDQEGKGKPRPKVHEMLNLYKEYLFFYYAEIPNNNDVHETEEKLLNTFVPFINTKIPKAKINPELKNIYEA